MCPFFFMNSSALFTLPRHPCFIPSVQHSSMARAATSMLNHLLLPSVRTLPPLHFRSSQSSNSFSLHAPGCSELKMRLQATLKPFLWTDILVVSGSQSGRQLGLMLFESFYPEGRNCLFKPDSKKFIHQKIWESELRQIPKNLFTKKFGNQNYVKFQKIYSPKNLGIRNHVKFQKNYSPKNLGISPHPISWKFHSTKILVKKPP